MAPFVVAAGAVFIPLRESVYGDQYRKSCRLPPWFVLLQMMVSASMAVVGVMGRFAAPGGYQGVIGSIGSMVTLFGSAIRTAKISWR